MRVRMYRVGFGDFFLLSVPSSDGHKHILIDCGVHHADIGSMNAAVAQMAEDCQYKLALIIMTHRHADHISGFAKCADVFKKISVDAVWMSWFEDPTNKEAVRAQAGLTAMAAELKTNLDSPAFAAAAGEDMDRCRFMAANITGDDGQGSNQAALNVLQGGFANQAVHTYYKAGKPAELPQSLIDAGLTAEILGPPDNLKLIGQMRKSSEEYLTDDEEDDDEAFSPFHPIFRVDDKTYPQDAFKYLSVEDIRARFLAFQFSALAASAQNADKFLNNQSLVVLFRFKGKSLLFVGDAQWGNWQNFLYGPDGGRRYQAGGAGHSEQHRFLQGRDITAAPTPRPRTPCPSCVRAASACARRKPRPITKCRAVPCWTLCAAKTTIWRAAIRSRPAPSRPTRMRGRSTLSSRPRPATYSSITNFWLREWSN